MCKVLRNSAIFAPSNKFNRVSATQFTALVDVDTALIIEKVLVDFEGDFEGPVGHEFLLNCFDVACNGVRSLPVKFVSFVLLFIPILAFLFAFWGGKKIVFAGLVMGFVAVVLARIEGVGTASGVQAVIGARDDSILHPKSPGGQRISPLKVGKL